MVAQNMLRIYMKYEKKIGFDDSVDVTECL